jgi:hypothetical protein
MLSICLFTGCYKNHLYVQQEWVDASFLASNKVNTPDPRKENPPEGQRLIIAWDFPKSLFQEGLTMVATVRLWNNIEEIFTIPLERKRDATYLFFSTKENGNEGKILTYRIQIFSKTGFEIETWEHHFWTKQIDLDRDYESSGNLHR